MSKRIFILLCTVFVVTVAIAQEKPNPQIVGCDMFEPKKSDKPKTVEECVKMRVDRLTKSLELTPEQAQQAYVLFVDNAKEVRELNKEAKKKLAEQKKSMREDTQEDFIKVLDKEQAAKYGELLEKREKGEKCVAGEKCEKGKKAPRKGRGMGKGGKKR